MEVDITLEYAQTTVEQIGIVFDKEILLDPSRRRSRSAALRVGTGVPGGDRVGSVCDTCSAGAC